MTQTDIALNTKWILTEKGLIHRVIAERAGFTPNVFSAMLNGRKLFLADYVVPVAKALGVTPNELFGVDSPSTSLPVHGQQAENANLIRGGIYSSST